MRSQKDCWSDSFNSLDWQRQVSLTKNLIELVRQQRPAQLDSWLERAKNSALKLFKRFAKGLSDDYDAAKAGVTFEVSHGQVED